MSGFDRSRKQRRAPALSVVLPTVFQLSPIAAVRRTISDYSLRSPRLASLALQCGIVSEQASLSHEALDLANPQLSSKPITADTKRKYAAQGSQLLNAALVESQAEDVQSQAFSRQLYLNSVSYLLHGLPSDLSEQEVCHLREALPESLDALPQIEDRPHRPQHPSVLHRGIAVLIVSLCLLVRVVLPYIKYLLAVAYDYERTHHVAENVLEGSLTTFDTFGKRSMEFAGSAVNNEVVMSSVRYCIEGICGGLNEGLGEGIKVIEARDKART